MNEKAIRVFIWMASIVLVIAGIAKLISSGGNARYLMASDPVFGIPFRNLFWLVGIIEVATFLLCTMTNGIRLKVVLLAWISCGFASYRLSLFTLGYQRPCPCLGDLTDAIGIPQSVADIAMLSIFVFLLFGSCFAAISLSKKDKFQDSSNRTGCEFDR